MIKKRINKLTAPLIFVFFIIISAAYNTYAIVHNLEAVLTGSQEVPPNNSLGSGFGNITYETDTNLLSWNISFKDLTGPAMGAHFHGPVPTKPDPDIVLDIGSISGLASPMIGSANINESDESNLLNNLWYVNIHTEEFPGGEIRGQANVVSATPVIPEPATIQFIGSGLLLLAGLKRMRK